MKPKESIQERVSALILECASAAEQSIRQRAAAGILEAHYLYFKGPHGTQLDGALRMFPQSANAEQLAADGWQLGHAEGLRCGVPYANYCRWIRERSSRLPILNPHF